MYYSSKRMFSHNSFINFVMSGRGTGKSYEGKSLVIKEYKQGFQSVYIRRTKVEIDEVKDTYWNDIKDNYPDLDFEVKGDIGYINGDIAVYFIALSTSTNKKSASYPLVRLILFDEYIVTPPKRYLKNEINLLLDLIETIGRKRTNLKVYIASNSVSYVNPLFSFFDIEVKPGKRFQKFRNNLIIVENFKSDDSFLKEKNDTPFAKLIKGTTYYDYAIGNEVLLDNNDFIEPRQPGLYDFVCSMKSNNYEVGFWYNRINGKYYTDNKVDKSSKHKFSILVEDAEPGYLQIKEYRTKTWRIKDLKRAYNNTNLFYLNQEIKKFVMEYIIPYI